MQHKPAGFPRDEWAERAAQLIFEHRLTREEIARFDAEEDGVTFLAYFLLSPGQEPELTMLS